MFFYFSVERKILAKHSRTPKAISPLAIQPKQSKLAPEDHGQVPDVFPINTESRIKRPEASKSYIEQKNVLQREHEIRPLNEDFRRKIFEDVGSQVFTRLPNLFQVTGDHSGSDTVDDVTIRSKFK
jgi:hypothetical protein